MTTLTIKLDEQLKAGVQKKVEREGMTLTALISQFFKGYLKDQYEFRLVPKAEVLKAHRELEEEIKSGKAKIYKTAKEMSDDILSE
jgi:antitoxin component of RelBE/YafQ-DinJ toxin-antitoxin module